jgi:hypothetical protein
MEMARAPAPASSRPRTVEAIYKDFAARRDGLVRALTSGQYLNQPLLLVSAFSR